MTCRARLGGRLDRRDPDARRRRDHAGGQGASLVGADLARLRAGRRADAHRPRRAAPVQRPEAGARALLHRRTLRPAARRRGRTSRRSELGPGVRDRGADRHRRGAAVLSYLFHRIEDRLDGSPTLLIIDEGWLALDDEGFAGQLREWLKTLRKKNASVVFATQSLPTSTARDRAGHHRKLPDPHLPAERARDRAADHRDLSPLRPQRPADRDPRAGHAQARLLLPVARGNRLFELGLGEVALASPPPRRRPTSWRSPNSPKRTGRTALPPHGCAIAASPGPPTCFPPLTIPPAQLGQPKE
jgi:hypothetical protein